jgi:nitroreductase family protein
MTPQEPDEYQRRYLAHQARKREMLAQLLAERHSNRVFGDRPVELSDFQRLTDAILTAPSSCDRRGVRALPITDRDTKALLGGLLVGGVGWVHRAPLVFLLLADRDAYKAGDEITYMPYLDAGAIIGQLGVAAASLDLAGSCINPNIREVHLPLFEARFGPDLFCGAYAVGHPGGETPPWVLETS